MPSHRLSKAIVSQVGEFVQTLGEDCAKPSRKFLRAMLLGMAMSGSVLLSESTRKIKSLTTLTFHAQHKKLCRGLKSKQWAAERAGGLPQRGRQSPAQQCPGCLRPRRHHHPKGLEMAGSFPWGRWGL